MHIFKAIIQPVLEYASPLWHGGLTQELSDNLEDQQKRACKIALPEMDYPSALDHLGMITLAERRNAISKTFFEKLKCPDDKLHKLLPAPIICRSTRNTNDYPLPQCKTDRYKNSFIPCALFNHQ